MILGGGKIGLGLRFLGRFGVWDGGFFGEKVRFGGCAFLGEFGLGS